LQNYPQFLDLNYVCSQKQAKTCQTVATFNIFDPCVGYSQEKVWQENDKLKTCAPDGLKPVTYPIVV
jgi:hypothetical protein